MPVQPPFRKETCWVKRPAWIGVPLQSRGYTVAGTPEFFAGRFAAFGSLKLLKPELSLREIFGFDHSRQRSMGHIARRMGNAFEEFGDPRNPESPFGRIMGLLWEEAASAHIQEEAALYAIAELATLEFQDLETRLREEDEESLLAKYTIPSREVSAEASGTDEPEQKRYQKGNRSMSQPKIFPGRVMQPRTTEPTLIHQFLKHNERFGDGKVAIRYKERSLWKEVTWKGYADFVTKVAAGLSTLGVGKGDKVSMLSSNCPEWFYCDLGIMALGAVNCPVYPNNIPEQVRYVVEHSESKVLFVQNEAQFKKTTEWGGPIESLKQVVVLYGKAPNSSAITLADLLKKGEEKLKEHPHFLKECAEKLHGDDLATIVYTSGTTGPPKGAMITHGNMVAEANSLLNILDLREEETISYLPLSHIAERLQGVICGVIAANTVNFAESLEKMKENLPEVRPTIFVGVPRVYEKFYAGINEGVKAAPPMKQKLFHWALSVGDKMRIARNGGPHPGWFTELQWNIAEKLVASKLKAKLGIDRVKLFISGAAPLSAKISQFFGSLGMDIGEVYGQTEGTGVSNANELGRIRPGWVGSTIPGQEVMIAEDGEILVRGKQVFMGYYKNPEATAETIQDGWLHTGDVGEYDETGYLRITDRKKDIIVTAGGKNVSPQNIENRLKTYPGVSQVVVIGDKRKYLTALFTLDPEKLPKLLQEHGIPEKPMSDLVNDEKLRSVIQGYLDSENKGLSSYESLKYFRLLPKDFTVESGELTPSLKVKRRVVMKNYADLIAKMYEGEESFE